MNFPMIAVSDIIPAPARSPVASRSVLLLSRLKYACVSPSITAGSMSRNDTSKPGAHHENVKMGSVRYAA